MKTIAQLLPRAPGGLDGVGDYALSLARGLRSDFGVETIFAAHEAPAAKEVDSFPIVSLRDLEKIRAAADAVVLHYVNYGFEKRGVPFWLPPLLRALDFPIFTIFHELFASGPPWRSEFWLRPWQKKLAREIALLSEARLVSNGTMADLLGSLIGSKSIIVQPVPSSLGEPGLSGAALQNRDPKIWAIFGGTVLLQRSFRSFAKILPQLPAPIRPATLYLLGGEENASLRREMSALPSVEIRYHPRVAREAASEIMARCAFLWLDYLRGQDVPGEIVLKSSAFASACAHGVVPVLAQRMSAIRCQGAEFPGTFYVDPPAISLPRTPPTAAIYQWYQDHASLPRLARTVARTLGLSGGEAKLSTARS